MLETIHEYAAELLVASGEAELVRRRHAGHMLAFAEEAAAPLAGGGAQSTSIHRLEEELENLRAAQAWASSAGELELEIRLLVAIEGFLAVRGFLGEGRRLFDGAVARSHSVDTRIRADLCVHAATFPLRQGDTAHARALLEEALGHFRALGDVDQAARCIGLLGNVSVGEGDFETAERRFQEAAAIARETGNDIRLAANLANLGAIASYRNDAPTAVKYQAEAVRLQRDLDDHDNLAITLHNLGRSQLVLGDLDESREILTESFELARTLGYMQVMAYCIGGFAELAMREGNAEHAALALGACRQLFAEIGAVLDPDGESEQAQIIEFAADALGAERAEELRTEGAMLSLDFFDVVVSASAPEGAR
jgi:tetratricopeptide (TPR) repeat protein